MTLTDFEAAYGRARELGHQWVQFKVAKKSEPRNWDRVQVMPMLYGTVPRTHRRSTVPRRREVRRSRSLAREGAGYAAQVQRTEEGARNVSYDIYLRSKPCEHCGRRGDEPMSHGPTYNLSPIFDLALTGEPLPSPEVGELEVVLFRKETERPRGLRILSGRKARDTIPMLENALKRMRDPALIPKFRELEPPNKWGTYEDGITVFEYLLKDAEAYPDNVWEIH